MSVGDRQGARRRFRVRQAMGHAPVPKGVSVGESIAREREKARRMMAASGTKKK